MKLLFKAGLMSCGALVLPTPTLAQDSIDQSDEVKRQYSTEIVVTAQKREQNLSDVPMSIQASSGEELRAFGVNDTADLGKIVSGFTSNDTAYGAPVFTIRGVGFQDTALASSPTVSVYV